MDSATIKASTVVPDASAPPPPPPPPTPSNHRRPRVREVSSRFMSPAVSSTAPRRRHHQQPEVDSSNSSDENHRPVDNSDAGTPFPVGCNSTSQCKGNLGNTTTTQRKQRAVKLFKENNNNGVGRDPSRSCSGRIGVGIGNGGFGATPSRPDTPTVVVPSRYRLTPQHRGNTSAAAKLLQASGMSLKGNAGSGWPRMETNSVSGDASSVCSDDDCRSDSGVSCSTQSLPELCSEVDMLPSVSNRSVAEKIGSRSVLSSSISSNSGSNVESKVHASPFHRSITWPSSCEKQTPSLSKLYGNQLNHVKAGGLSLPPVPPSAKPVAETRKGKKGSSNQEDVHSLRLMYNRYLQWRYANAKAVSAMKVQQRESERVLYSQAMKISEMRDSVNRKRVELELLRRSKTLSTILDAQIPYLDEWSALEEEYSLSISEAIQALLNATVQLPLGGNVRVDVKEVGESLNSASKMMETIVLNIQRFMPKAEQIDVCISELARVVSGERAVIGECGDLLSKTYKSQVEECSLRGQLIQLYSTCHNNNNNNNITEQEGFDSSVAICAGNEPC
ncbi:protein ENDOSPERM DEFECTIVE 1-like isoform X1 [Arachis duranensis]|uniref:Protein ENDOSPERM DEFECTIVE 1-like isoform X1 n=1 Tax=Arachis duranensis TaxID=130453 RepID=A0A6P4D4J1_ARADU|nr:protein ENDOSPERM DEFECTIVE 1-like isoform X1 [Arachis duranensis]